MKQWLKRIRYIPQHSKPTDDNIMRLLMPSFAAIVICMICLVGTSWAWFSASVQTAPQTIKAADFDISVSITDNNNVSIDPVASQKPHTFNLESGAIYTVTLNATGNAPSGGYCKVECGDTATRYTTTLKPAQSLIFTLIPETNAMYTFTAVWGEYSGEADIINDNDRIGSKQPDVGTKTPDSLTDSLDKAGLTVQSNDIPEQKAEAPSVFSVPDDAEQSGNEPEKNVVTQMPEADGGVSALGTSAQQPPETANSAAADTSAQQSPETANSAATDTSAQQSPETASSAATEASDIPTDTKQPERAESVGDEATDPSSVAPVAIE